ncbi:MAG: glutamate--tRNA ligase [Selenomonadaceae bacterium]|nr:glutamate--tRNA ligase [Selenomonadaceae bacterium]
MNKVRTRFAPSPTGYMHIGNLRTALYAYLFAKSQHGDFILRIEDTDRARYVPDAVEFIEKTLAAAKIIPDEGPHHGGNFGPYVQSERMEIYKAYAEKLVELGYAYRCFCNHDDDSNEGDEKKFGGYDRTCRHLEREEIEANLVARKPYVIRQKMPLTGETTFYDVLHGNITISNSELEDQILLKSDGMPTYNFANVIDDHLMGVTHIIRGTEFITSTPKHVLLYENFGWEIPTFIHLAPVMGKSDDGTISKLSKRHGATSFNDLVEMGYLPEVITNYVALLGWSPKTNQEIFSMDELIEKFSLDGLSKSPAVFDYNKLDWMSGEYFKAMSDEDFAQAAEKFFGTLNENLASKKIYLGSLLKPRISKLSDIHAQIKFLQERLPLDAELFTNKRNKVTAENSVGILTDAIKVLEKISDWTVDELHEKITAFVTESGLKMGTIMWALRIALSGQKVTPGGVIEILYLLGKKESLERLNAALKFLGDIAKKN